MPIEMKHFNYSHLPERLQLVSRPFGELAKIVLDMDRDDPNDPELEVALRKLLEAKDAAVRSVL